MGWFDDLRPSVGQIEADARRKRLEKQQEREREAANEAAMQARLAPLLKLAEGGNVGAMREAAAILCSHHRITVVEKSANALHAEGVGAYAVWGARKIVVPPIDSAEDFAVRLHEAAHILAGPCGGGDHKPDPNVMRWTHCLKCEADAWRIAMTLAPFSREMFQRLQRSLASYRNGTPGPDSAKTDVDRVRGSVNYATQKQQRLMRDWRREWLASVQAEVTRDHDRESDAFNERMRQRWANQ